MVGRIVFGISYFHLNVKILTELNEKSSSSNQTMLYTQVLFLRLAIID